MRALLALLLVAGLAGCAGHPAAAPGDRRPGEPPSGTAEPQPAWASCAAVGAPNRAEDVAVAITLPRLGADFVPTAVVVCQLRPERRPDGGEDLMAVEGRASEPADVAAVLDALRLPSQTRTDHICTADLPGVPWFAVVDGAGRWVRPGVPVDECGKIRIEVRRAVEELTLVRIGAQRVGELESSGAAASGCVQQWADMVWVTGQVRQSPPPAGRADPFAPGAELRLCVYAVPAGERGGGKPAGTFERGGLLPAARRDALPAALRQTAAAPDCTTPASRFALVRPADNTTGTVYVELDGCTRVLIEQVNGPSWVGKADPALIALLT